MPRPENVDGTPTRDTSSVSEQPIDLEDERAVGELRKTRRPRVPLLVVDDEELAAGWYSQRRRTLAETELAPELYCTSALTNIGGVIV